MTATRFTPELLQFRCPSCGVELTVPAALAGIEGPCPSCCQTIHAPLPEALYEFSLDGFDPDPGQPAGRLEHRVFPAPRIHPAPGIGTLSAPEKNFRARLAIPPPDEPLDDSWKDRHRDQRRQNRRARKVEKVAQSFLDSRVFQITRVALILLSGAMLVWLFQYLRTHEWRLPGMPAPVANESRPTATGGVAGQELNAADETASDDDAEIPPAASETPAWNDPAQQFAPVASPSAPR